MFRLIRTSVYTPLQHCTQHYRIAYLLSNQYYESANTVATEVLLTL